MNLRAERVLYRKIIIPWAIVAVALALAVYVSFRSAGRLEPAYHIGQLTMVKGEALAFNLQFSAWPPYLGDLQATGIIGAGTEILDVVQSEYSRPSPLAVHSQLTVRLGANAVGACTITGIQARIGAAERVIPVGRIEVQALDSADVQGRRSAVVNSRMSTSWPGPFTITVPLPAGENVMALEPPLDGAEVAISNQSGESNYVFSTWSFQFPSWMWNSPCYVIYRPIIISTAGAGEQGQRSLGPLLEFGLEPSPRR